MEFVDRYRRVRAVTEALCAPLQIEDYLLQGMADASPPRWHLAHVTWFFETFLLVPHAAGYVPREPLYRMLFNSYYDGVGPQWPRAFRHGLSRPTVAEIYDWRREVDDALSELLSGPEVSAEMLRIAEIGLHHEQQHQELLVTDLKYSLLQNPLVPVYRDDLTTGVAASPSGAWVDFSGGLVEVGHAGPGFHWDNEGPRHPVFLAPFRLGADLVSNAEFAAFITDGGYHRPDLWLADGWDVATAAGWEAPLYWEDRDGEWLHGTLGGLRPVDPNAPVTHVSFYEAEAYARWAGHRLPTELEWEHAADRVQPAADGTFADDDAYHPLGRPAPAHGGLRHLLGEVWEWTGSAYLPYPGYRPDPGVIGEYNGKFMNDQRVLRGGSCATPRDHIRITYRNFFQGDKRWQFTGIRLARGP